MQHGSATKLMQGVEAGQLSVGKTTSSSLYNKGRVRVVRVGLGLGSGGSGSTCKIEFDRCPARSLLHGPAAIRAIQW